MSNISESECVTITRRELELLQKQSDDQQSRGWELGAQLDASIEHLQNLLGHLDTLIGRRKLGIDPSADWLLDTRAFCASFGDNEAPTKGALDAQCVKAAMEMIMEALARINNEGIPGDKTLRILERAQSTLNSASSEEAYLTLDACTVSEIQDALRGNASEREKNNALAAIELAVASQGKPSTDEVLA